MTGRLEEALASSPSSDGVDARLGSPDTGRRGPVRGGGSDRTVSALAPEGDIGGVQGQHYCYMPGTELQGSDPGATTPTRRNKRKMTAPKRRSDFSIKRFCPDEDDDRRDDLEDYDDLAREGVPERAGGSTGTESLSPDSRREDTPPSSSSSIVTSPSGTVEDYSTLRRRHRPPFSPSRTPDDAGVDTLLRRGARRHRRSPSSRVPEEAPRNEEEDEIPSPSSPHLVDPTARGHHRHRRDSNAHDNNNNDTNEESHLKSQPTPLALHHPAFGLSRHLAVGALPAGAHLPPVPMATPPGLLPGHPNHPAAAGSKMQGHLLPMPHLQVGGYHHHPGGPHSPSGGSEFQPHQLPHPATPGPPSPADSTSSRADGGSSSSGSKKARKNYKNMTRERRVEANARERSRVHTISAAFESLRRAVPSYSYNQKLSKLAILRIACTYILSLAKLADLDLSTEHSDYTFADCVDMCTSVIQTEGRARRRH